jgi:lipopolysaccharide export system protein LptA
VDRRRLLKLILSSLFIGFLLLLAYKFKPKLDMPAPGPPEKTRRTPQGTLSAKGFHYVQRAGSKVEFDVTASEVAEAKGGLKVLADPVLLLPGQGKAWGKQGSFDPATQALRIWEDAHLRHQAGWEAASSGFRLTPEGEVVSESSVEILRRDVRGSADLLRYQRKSQVAHLEGQVRFTRGVQSFTCSRIIADFASHGGQIAGPVVLSSDQGTITAPAGIIFLSDSNQLTGLSLGSPCVGEGPKGHFSARSLMADVGPGGEVKAVHLREDAVVGVPGPPPTTLASSVLDLDPKGDGVWHWSAPGALAVERDRGRATASSGTGLFGGAGEPSAELAGPVRGRDERGTFRGDRAKLEGGDWVLLGHATVERSQDTVNGDTVTYKKDGSSEAAGHVAGSRKAAGQPELDFSSDRAFSGAGGYPVRLEGHVKARRDGFDLSAERATIRDAQTAEAEGNTVGVFKAKDGRTDTVKADALTFDGGKHEAAAVGKARAEGKDYWVTAPKILAFLNEDNQPVRYETEGDSSFEGPSYKGQGERLIYAPAAQQGRAYGYQKSAVVIQKEPYRRVSAPAISYSEKQVEVLPQEHAPMRGSLEGVQLPALKKTAPPPPKPQKKT